MTDQTPPVDEMDYETMTHEALRTVIRDGLLRAASPAGLPGAHHFYITFKTQAAGVDIPRHLVERFPDEMTIVLQNKFWDLKVSEDQFQVSLTFNQVAALLTIPFAAITAFVDPAVNFALQFQAQADDESPEPHDEAENDAPQVTSEDGSNVVTVDFGKKK